MSYLFYVLNTGGLTVLLQVGLGTDCSGGYSPSMLDSMRLAVLASNTVHFSKRTAQVGAPPTPSMLDSMRLAVLITLFTSPRGLRRWVPSPHPLPC
jgi:hypothetical protein